jgi:hypothetical protein
MSYSLPAPWKRKLFVALCRRYGLAPYREKGQRASTVLVLAPRRFHNKTLWPEYLALAEELEKHLADLTDRVIREAIHTDVSEAEESEPSTKPTSRADATCRSIPPIATSPTRSRRTGMRSCGRSTTPSGGPRRRQRGPRSRRRSVAASRRWHPTSGARGPTRRRPIGSANGCNSSAPRLD